MQEMTDEDGQKYNVSNREYVEIDITKANYTARLPGSLYFKRVEGGILETVNMNSDRLEILSRLFVDELLSTNKQISKNDLIKKKDNAKSIIKNLKGEAGFNHKNDMKNIINYSLENKLLTEEKIETDKVGAPRFILKEYQLPPF
jgi:hypothetical protein